MKRAVLAAFIAVLLAPGAGAAQNMLGFNRPAWGPRIRVTPFGGFAAAASRTERWTVSGNGQTAAADFDVSLAAGPAAGASFEVRVVERFAIQASGAWVSRGRTTERITGGAEFIEHEGSTFMFARAAGVLRLREEVSELQVHTLTGSLFFGPAWVRETPKTDPIVPQVLLEPLNHVGLSFGFDAEIPLPYDALSFTAGIEDYLIWWNTKELARRNDVVILQQNGIDSQSYVESPPTHNLLFKAGVTLRFR